MCIVFNCNSAQTHVLVKLVDFRGLSCDIYFLPILLQLDHVLVSGDGRVVKPSPTRLLFDFVSFFHLFSLNYTGFTIMAYLGYLPFSCEQSLCFIWSNILRNLKLTSLI